MRPFNCTHIMNKLGVSDKHALNQLSQGGVFFKVVLQQMCGPEVAQVLQYRLRCFLSLGSTGLQRPVSRTLAGDSAAAFTYGLQYTLWLLSEEGLHVGYLHYPEVGGSLYGHCMEALSRQSAEPGGTRRARVGRLRPRAGRAGHAAMPMGACAPLMYH